MSEYRPRLAAGSLAKAAGAMPVVVLTGSRQTGKSTLVRTETPFRDHLYLTLDDLGVRERARHAADDLVRSAPRIVLDEVQRAPDLLLAVKRAVDDDPVRMPGRFVLTGSANLLLMSRVSETLAGRAAYQTLWPMTRREKLGLGRAGCWSDFFATPAAGWFDLMRNQSAPAAQWRDQARVGGYPTPSINMSRDHDRAIWFDGYVKTYLERDLQDLSAIENVIDFRRLMKATTLRLGNLLNQAELGRDIQLARPTVHRYLNLLEASFQLIRLAPYSINRTKRLVRTPKAYWCDSGLARHLSGVEELPGAYLENMVLSDLLAWQSATIPQPEVFFWRTSEDLEVDFVIEYQGRLLPVEVKATRSPGTSDVRGLVAFRDDYGSACPGGLFLYDGAETQWLSRNILAVPWHQVV